MSTATEQRKAGGHTAEEWVAGFTEGWRAPTDADSFCDHFENYLSTEMRLIQPQIPEIVGLEAFREEFARPLFELLHDIRGTVNGWAARDDLVFVDLTIRGKLAGGREVELHTIDKITLRDGMAVERFASADPVPLLLGVAITPRSWPAFLKARISALRR